MNYARNEDAIPASNMAPALAWLKATGGEPTRIEFWRPRVNTWAFGVGAILGTMGSSIIFNLKGVILLELSGPRLLLMMKANVLMVMPQLKGTGEGLLLAVIDLDMGRGTLTIGIFIDFKVDPLLRIRIPVEAFFNFNDVKDWHLYLGRYQDPVHAKILEVFEGTGYLMISGNGISGIPKLPAVSGFSIATGLHVSFLWGSKSIGLYAELAAGLDALRGVVPAQVEGAVVRCPPSRQRPALGAPVRALPAPTPGFLPEVIAAARGRRLTEVFADEQVSFVDVVRRLNSGLAVSRSILAPLVGGGIEQPPAAAVAPRRCQSRMLAAPVFHSRRPQPFGSPERLKRIEEGFQSRGFKPGPFDDAVIFHTGEVRRATFYLLVHNRVLEGRLLVVAQMDAGEGILAQRLITAADRLPPAAFPSTWMDPQGPWRDDMELLVQHQTLLVQAGYSAVVVSIDGVPKTDTIQIGLLPQDPKWHRAISGRPFYVAAIEALRRSEMLRFDYDNSEQKKKQGVLETALGPESADHALLAPNTLYGVTLTWDASRERRPPGQPPTDKKDVTGRTQTFWFKTDSEAPRRLDPWMLCSIPEEGETHYFTAEALKIVFGTNNVARIYDAYGKRLQVRLKAASMRPTPSSAAVPHPFVLNDLTLQPVKAAVLSPWEATVADLVRGSCVPVHGERTRHTMATIPIPLEPFTDYVLDIEAVPAAAPDGASGPSVWRRSFSTGAFPTVEEFARSFMIAALEHRFAQPGALQAIGPMFASAPPQGSQLDEALMGAGLEPLPVPKFPRVVVFWQTSGGGPPQPAAVLIDSSEPMWRARAIPRELTDPGPAAARRFELVPVEWLALAEQPGGDAVVDRIVRAPGGQRALVTLKANSRGKRLRLALKRIAQNEPYLDGPSASDAFFTVADFRFVRAPWEED